MHPEHHHLHQQQPPLQNYQVRVGYVAVTVACRSRTEAVRLARRQFCQELPQMWDKIQKLEDCAFCVEPQT